MYTEMLQKALLAESAFDLDGQLALAELVLHVPHASAHIPDRAGYVVPAGRVQQEVARLTDWCTDELFAVPGATALVAPFSRVFCDVERLPDAQEPMYVAGRGFFYIHCDDGTPLREGVVGLKSHIRDTYYLPHHAALQQLVATRLTGVGRCTILDCHSFSDEPFASDPDQRRPRPDVCLGTDAFHTPDRLVEKFAQAFARQGYTVAINAPYSGTIVPLTYYQQERQVLSIMLEVNRRLYLTPNNAPRPAELARLNRVLRDALQP